MYIADQQLEQQIECHGYSWCQNSANHQKDANLVSAPILNAYSNYNSQATDYRAVCHFIQSGDQYDVDRQFGSTNERDQSPTMQKPSCLWGQAIFTNRFHQFGCYDWLNGVQSNAQVLFEDGGQQSTAFDHEPQQFQPQTVTFQ
ncbi:OLC1v1016323C1 [Oldenlandia corymbosa var. corymbosa]|uniref:OLC1v1016323C1 n=1 Tax=Oldenlandia corymbosa var. corymbosa TaxID=529605 RepID=A0AAV1E7E3_OLDCO|nr:OLC1v1016323C1 [Oldenlandia corymbosa var. corymbosa]